MPTQGCADPLTDKVVNVCVTANQWNRQEFESTKCAPSYRITNPARQ
jgi:hypothetical protein